mgnify:CR=1 FL=1
MLYPQMTLMTQILLGCVAPAAAETLKARNIRQAEAELRMVRAAATVHYVHLFRRLFSASGR